MKDIKAKSLVNFVILSLFWLTQSCGFKSKRQGMHLLPDELGYELLKTALVNPPDMKIYGRFEVENGEFVGKFLGVLKDDSLKIVPLTSVPLSMMVLSFQDYPELGIWFEEGHKDLHVLSVNLEGSDTIIVAKSGTYKIESIFENGIPKSLTVVGGKGLRLHSEEFVSVGNRFFPKKVSIEGLDIGLLEVSVDSLEIIQ